MPAGRPRPREPAVARRTARSCPREAAHRSRAVAAAAARGRSAPPAAAEDEGRRRTARRSRLEDATHYATAQPSLPLAGDGGRPGADAAEEGARRGRAPASPSRSSTPASPRRRRIDIAGTEPTPATMQPVPVDYHGTAVAGLIAGNPRRGGGPVGIAPGARIFDVQVYDDPAGSTAPDSTEVADHPREPAPGARRRDRRGRVAGDPDREHLAGDPRRPRDPRQDRPALVDGRGGRGTHRQPVPEDLPPGMPSSFEGHTSGEDAAAYVHPADYDNVLGVSATPAGVDRLQPDHLGHGELDDRRGRADRGRGVLLAARRVVPTSPSPPRPTRPPRCPACWRCCSRPTTSRSGPRCAGC